MSVFTALPQDMLQHEINHFLDPVSRANWNEVLKKDERVYKKLYADYAIKHQIRLSHENYQALAKKLELSIGRVQDGGWDEIHIPKSIKLLKKFFAFFKDPKNQVVLMHVKGRKRAFVDMMIEWTEEDLDFYENLSDEVVDELRVEAAEAVILIAKVPYIRNVRIAGHKSAFE
jgi:hypothetical protein